MANATLRRRSLHPYRCVPEALGRGLGRNRGAPGVCCRSLFVGTTPVIWELCLSRDTGHLCGGSAQASCTPCSRDTAYEKTESPTFPQVSFKSSKFSDFTKGKFPTLTSAPLPVRRWVQESGASGCSADGEEQLLPLPVTRTSQTPGPTYPTSSSAFFCPTVCFRCLQNPMLNN